VPATVIHTPELDDDKLAPLRRLGHEFGKALEAGAVIDEQALQVIGRALWATGIDTDAVTAALETARASGEPARVVIESDQAAVQDLPWELLYHDHDELGFIGLHPQLAVLRRLRPVSGEAPIGKAAPLRVLVFNASPDDLAPSSGRLDLEQEQEKILAALDDRISAGEAVVEIARDGTATTLERHLGAKNLHVAYLSLHGEYDYHAEQGSLLLEAEETYRSRRLTEQQLEELIARAGIKRTPCVVLSACRSAGSGTGDALAGVAQRLSRAGVPLVIGMRHAVRDVTATEMAAGLFEALGNGAGLVAAVQKARACAANTDVPGAWANLVVLIRDDSDALVDPSLPVQPLPSMAEVPASVGGVPLLREGFVGRRRAMRELWPDLAAGRQPHLLLTGVGGTGKTTLAGYLLHRLQLRERSCHVAVYRAPFDISQLLLDVSMLLDDSAIKRLQDKEPEQALPAALQALARQRPCCLLLDNLESVQDLRSGVITDQASWSAIEAVLAAGRSVRVLLTGRYPVPQLERLGVRSYVLAEAPLGDILIKMRRLSWPRQVTVAEKEQIYRVFGGNFRAIEWLRELLEVRPERWRDKLSEIAAVELPADADGNQADLVLAAMRENLLFSELVDILSPAARTLLRRMSVYDRPVTIHGVRCQLPGGEDAEALRDELVRLRLLVPASDPDLSLPLVAVPPIVASLAEELSRDEELLRAAHRAAGLYHRHMGEHVTRWTSDDLAAIEHLNRAGEPELADEVAIGLSVHLNRRCLYKQVVGLLARVVECDDAPWKALNEMGACHRALGDYQRALELHLRAERAAKEVPELRQKYGTTLNNISMIYQARGEYDEALEYLKQTLAIDRELEDRAGEGTTLNNISQIYDARGDYGKALEYLEQSLAIRREIGDRSGEGATLNNISAIHHARGDSAKALEYMEQSLAIIREIGDRSGEGTTLNNISQIYRARGDYGKALEYLEQSLAIRREIGDRSGEGTTLNNISAIHHARGDSTKALEYLEQSLAIRREIGDRSGMVATLHNIASIHHAQGELQRALTSWTEALELARATGDAEGLFNVCAQLGMVLCQGGAKEQGLPLVREAVAIGRRIGHPITAQVEAMLAQLEG
jgi:tetratricopeptide (TPR) repeat protein